MEFFSRLRMVTDYAYEYVERQHHSLIVAMFFLGLALSPCTRTSSTVGSEASKRADSNSSTSRSINSPRQVFSANFEGIEREMRPTVTA